MRKFQFLNLALTTSLVALAVVAPASAQQPTVGKMARVDTGSRDICSRLPENLIEEEQFWLRMRMLSMMPEVFSARISEIRFEEDREGIFPGPHVDTVGSSIAITVPPAFIKRLCVIIQLQMEAASNYDTVDDMPESVRLSYQTIGPTLASEVQECLGQRGPILGITRNGAAERSGLDCLEFVANRYLVTGRNRQSTAEDSDLSAAVFAYQAAEFLIAHELGHVVLEKAHTSKALAKLDVELEADLLAQQAMLGDGSVPFGPAMAMASYTLMEGPAKRGAGTHQLNACRFSELLYGTVIVGNSITKLNKLAAGSWESDREVESDLDELPNLPYITAYTGDIDCEKKSSKANNVASEIDRFLTHTRLVQDNLTYREECEEISYGEKICINQIQNITKNIASYKFSETVAQKLSIPAYLSYLYNEIEFADGNDQSSPAPYINADLEICWPDVGWESMELKLAAFETIASGLDYRVADPIVHSLRKAGLQGFTKLRANAKTCKNSRTANLRKAGLTEPQKRQIAANLVRTYTAPMIVEFSKELKSFGMSPSQYVRSVDYFYKFFGVENLKSFFPSWDLFKEYLRQREHLELIQISCDDPGALINIDLNKDYNKTTAFPKIGRSRCNEIQDEIIGTIEQ